MAVFDINRFLNQRSGREVKKLQTALKLQMNTQFKGRWTQSASHWSNGANRKQDNIARLAESGSVS
jgi:hypothetical protein